MQITTHSSVTARGGFLAGLASVPAQFVAWVEKRRRVATAIRELSWHSDRELADLGVSRGDIVAVAEGRARYD